MGKYLFCYSLYYTDEIDLQTSGLMRCHDHRRWQDFLYPAKYAKPEEPKNIPPMFDLPKIDIAEEIHEKCKVLYFRYMTYDYFILYYF